MCNARMCLKSTARHYKTIKFNIKILLNIHNLQFCGAERAENVEIFLTFAPSIRKMDRRPWECLYYSRESNFTHAEVV